MKRFIRAMVLVLVLLLTALPGPTLAAEGISENQTATDNATSVAVVESVSENVSTIIAACGGPSINIDTSNTTPAQAVLSGTTLPFLDITLSSTTGTPIPIDGMTFRRTGISRDEDVENINLYNGTTALGPTIPFISNPDHKAIFDFGIVNITEEGYRVTLYADTSLTAQTGDSVAFELMSIDSPEGVEVPFWGGENGVKGNLMTVVPGPNLTISCAPDTPTSHDIVMGSSDVSTLEAQINVSAEGLGGANIHSMPVKVLHMENGNPVPVQSYDVSNVWLSDNKTIFVGPVSVISNGIANFPQLDWQVEAEDSPKKFSVKLDVPSGSSASNFFVQIDGADIVATNTANGARVSFTGNATGNVMTVVDAETATATLNVNSPAGQILPGQNQEMIINDIFTTGNARIEKMVYGVNFEQGNAATAGFNKFSLYDSVDLTLVLGEAYLGAEVEGKIIFNFSSSNWPYLSAEVQTLCVKGPVGEIMNPQAIFSLSLEQLEAVGITSCKLVNVQGLPIIGNTLILGNPPGEGIVVSTASTNTIITSPWVIAGHVTGENHWSTFEGQAGMVKLLDANGIILAEEALLTGVNWTQLPVAFTATLTFDQPTTSTGTLVFSNENTKGDPEWNREHRIEIRFATPEPSPSITVTSPNEGDVWTIGETHEIKWESSGLDKVIINVTDYTYSSEIFMSITTNISAVDGTYSWTIPLNFFTDPNWKSSDNFKIFVAELKTNDQWGTQDESDFFSIVAEEEVPEPGLIETLLEQISQLKALLDSLQQQLFSLTTQVELINAPQKVAPNSDFGITIGIEAVTDLNAAQYDIQFDPAALEPINFTNGDLGSPMMAIQWNQISPGTVRIIHSMGLGGASSNSPSYLAVGYFHVKNAAEIAPTTITLTDGILSGFDGEIPSTWGEKTLEIFLLGDSNGDGTVNVLDMTKTARVILGLN